MLLTKLICLRRRYYFERRVVEPPGRRAISDGTPELVYEQTQAIRYMAMLPLVRNYYAELLMHQNYAEHNLEEAGRLLIETAQESESAGSPRTMIAALSMLGRVALLQGHVDRALEHSTRAIEELKKMDMAMPALRTEEMLFNHYAVLMQAGRADEATDYIKEAKQVISRKGLYTEERR